MSYGTSLRQVYKEEKIGFFAVLFSSIVLFLAGFVLLFCNFSTDFTFFVQASPSEVLVMTDINEYIDFIVRILFVFGFAFEVPIILMLMIWSGVTNTYQLSSARPYVIIGCFVVGMFLTPPDIFSQTLLALPVWLLYEVGLLASRFFIKK